MSAFLISSLALVILQSTAASADDTPRLSKEEGLNLVRAFLFQDFVNAGSSKYTAAAFADPEKNALAALGLTGHPRAELIRGLVLKDYDVHREEYWVRAHMGQARAQASGDTSEASYQRHLWSIFLDDPRYTSRILALIAESVPVAFAPDSPPRQSVRFADVRRISDAMALSLRDRARETGCDSSPLAAVPAVANEDPLVVTTIFLFFTTHDPSERTVSNAKQSLLAAGWTVQE